MKGSRPTGRTATDWRNCDCGLPANLHTNLGWGQTLLGALDDEVNDVLSGEVVLQPAWSGADEWAIMMGRESEAVRES